MADQNNKARINILLQTLNDNPNLWETRKKTAELLYAEKEYLQAADIIWNAPEIPATDVDIAFVLKMISRVKPNRSIRLIYEIVRRNQNKPHKNLAVAKALNAVGMYMEASRFYGAALASDSSLFDLGFERQTLWLDDSGRLLEEWKKSDQESKPPLDVSEQTISGGAISPGALSQNPGQAQQEVYPEQAYASQNPPVAPLRQATNPLLRARATPPPHPSITQPLMTNPAAAPQQMTPPAQPVRHATNPLLRANPAAQAMPTATQPLMMSPVATQPLIASPVRQATNPLLRVNPTAPPRRMATQALMPNPVATQPLMTNPSAEINTPAATPQPIPHGQPLQYAPLPLQPPVQAPQPPAPLPEKPKFKLK